MSIFNVYSNTAQGSSGRHFLLHSITRESYQVPRRSVCGWVMVQSRNASGTPAVYAAEIGRILEPDHDLVAYVAGVGRRRHLVRGGDPERRVQVVSRVCRDSNVRSSRRSTIRWSRCAGVGRLMSRPRRPRPSNRRAPPGRSTTSTACTRATTSSNRTAFRCSVRRPREALGVRFSVRPLFVPDVVDEHLRFAGMGSRCQGSQEMVSVVSSGSVSFGVDAPQPEPKSVDAAASNTVAGLAIPAP